jgi:hypothetical protein
MTKYEESELLLALMELHHAPGPNEHVDEAYRIIQDLLNRDQNDKGVEEEKRKFTMRDFFDGLRSVVTDAREWWHRCTSQEENNRLLKKYGVDDITDEAIVNMYVSEHPDLFNIEQSVA